ncbi:(d)CMP kinase [Oxalobacteraceae sp. CFBP 13730]|jgi:cytidylate kinase|uniref:(d)CMP kinase n=1 Tax=Massilia sp. TaxID=1882437 RepID=UPI0019C1C563|nr:(d)CMP kinase [Oxalobacteraceae sp. CFBP 8763]MBD8654575.1 (d)CMP kinase [Oxalobacteraceae sp. CFBP 13730]MBD8722436.1 (d)CMP kinase [Oxalobacteraceae sp. CFBP 13708]
MPNSNVPVITIDGPTASGKGTVASRIADRLGFHLLDSGALYRLTALQALRGALPLSDEAGIAKLAQQLPARFRDDVIYLADEDVSHAIRAEEVGNMASKIAALPSVRQALFDLQLGFRQAPGLVADGRDMGTVIFPTAKLKVFLTASAEARAQRRYKQLIDKGFSANMNDLLADLRARDERDTGRAVAPLVAAADAHILDTSAMGVDQAVEQVLTWYAQK